MRSFRRFQFALGMCTGLSLVGSALWGVLQEESDAIADHTGASGVQPLAIEIVAAHGVGDGRLATEAPIGSVVDVATDASGSTYFVDTTHLRVRRVRSDGIIDTVFNGHELADAMGVASSPRAVAVDDGRGVTYVADERANRLWAIRQADTIVFAGSGAFGLEGDGGPASDAALNVPVDVAVGADGSVYIADMANHRIRAVGPDGSIRTVLGELSPGIDCNTAMNTKGLFLPERVAVALDGSLYVVDRQGRRLQHVLPGGATTELLSGSGTVTGLGVTTDGTLVVVSAGQLLERRDGGWLRRDPADPDGLLSSAAAALGPGVASYRPRDHTLVRLAPDRRAERIGGNGTTGRFGDGGPANGASFTCHDIVVAASGQILFSDPFNQRVARMQTNGIIETFAGLADDGRVAGGIALAPMGVTLDANQALHIADFGHHRIVKVTSDGASTVVAGNGAAGFAGDGAPAIDAALDSPFDVAVAVSGELFITDSGNRRVRRVDMQGIISTLVALDFEPGSLAIQPNGDLLVMERTGSALVEIRLQDGPSVTPLDGGAGGADVIPGHRIDAIAIAGTDSLLVAANGDLWNVALPLAASPAGGFTAIGSLKPSRTVSAMTMDAAGNLLVCDAAHRRILRISAASLNEARAPFMAGSGASL